MVQQTDLLIRRMAEGDKPQALNELIERTQQRMIVMTRKMLSSYGGLSARVTTDDVFQGAMCRLIRALDQVTVVDRVHFFRLASTQMRRELMDLAKHYRGPRAQAVDQVPPQDLDDSGETRSPADDVATSTHDPDRLATWTDLHWKVGTLSEPSRQIIDLMFYQGLSADEAARELGCCPETARRLWRRAVQELHNAMNGQLPDL